MRKREVKFLCNLTFQIDLNSIQPLCATVRQTMLKATLKFWFLFDIYEVFHEKKKASKPFAAIKFCSEGEIKTMYL